jgi:uncharacterized membrane protein YgcG
MKRHLAIVALFFISCGTQVWADQIPLPATKARVVDTTGTLTTEQISALQKRSDDLDKRTGAVIIAVMIPTTGEESIDQYSLRLAEAWAPGHAKDERAAILVIAKNDQKIRIETSRVIGTKLTDVAASRIIRLMSEQALSKKVGHNFYKAFDIFYTEVEAFIPPKEELAVTQTKVSEGKDNYIVFGILFLLCSMGVLTWRWWYRVDQRKYEEDERIREEAKRMRVHSEILRNLRASLSRQVAVHSTTSCKSSTLPAAALTGYAASKVTERKRQEEEAERRRKRDRDDEDNRRNTSYGSFSDSSSSSSSSSSSFDSGSSNTSFDGGGSSGNFD